MAEEVLNNKSETVIDESLFIIVENNTIDSEKIDAPAYSYWRSVLRSFFRNKANIVALVLLIIILGMSFIQPMFSNYVHNAYIDDGIAKIHPFQTFEHIFGTDRSGNDLFDYTWKGAQFSLSIAFIATGIVMVIGILVGALWGYSKFFDKIFTEVYNIVANVPSLVVTIIIVYALGLTYWNMIIAMTCTGWLGIAYSFRTQVIIIRDRDYNLASRCLGTGTFKMITHNILPFLVSIIVTYVSNYLPSFIGYEVTLSYLKIGFGTDVVSLGSHIASTTALITTDEPYIFWIPVAVSALLTITLYVVGQGLADASDPRNHR